MALWVVNGAKMACPMGTTPATLVVLPARMVNVANQPAATVMDHAPMVNIPTFGMCQTPSNPQVAAATSAAMGVLTPQPCIPNTTAPWVPGAITVNDTNQIALNNASKCMCLWGGAISITDPGQTATQVP
jgi:hypothetical protein